MKLDELTQSFDIDSDITINPDYLFEMSNVREKDSGLNLTMFISSKKYINGRHGPRIKV